MEPGITVQRTPHETLFTVREDWQSLPVVNRAICRVTEHPSA
jgi:hypothetical protein